MSKAFVIKNKEGKYYDCWAVDFTDTINECAIYQDRQTAENDIKYCIKDNEYLDYKDDCEVVEITIAEGDLIEEIEGTARNLCHSQIKVRNLEQQLAEKDKEIERLKQENDKLAFALAEEPDKDELLELKQDFDILYNKTKERDASIRKQLCDDIREKLKKQILPAGGNWLVFYDVKETNDLLDQIEQAKESIDDNKKR